MTADVELLARHLADEYYTDEDWPKLPERKREYYRSKAREILDLFSGRLVPEGAKTQWGCSTPDELRFQDPVRWSTREAVEEHGNCGRCVIVSRIVTPWTPAEEEK